MIEQLAACIQESQSIVFFGGAGVSTESGIPDFRSEDGIFNAQDTFGYAPEELLSVSFFHENPDLFFNYYRNNMLFPNAEPGPAHHALARLEQMGRLTAVVTQNIDDLHQKAGSKTVYELHGTMRHNYCTQCGAPYSAKYMLSPTQYREHIPLCTTCGGIVRPDIVLYGESLDDDTYTRASDAINRADILIVGGTSLMVYPAASLLHYFHGKALILINKEPTEFDNKATMAIHDRIGFVLTNAIDLIS